MDFIFCHFLITQRAGVRKLPRKAIRKTVFTTKSQSLQFVCMRVRVGVEGAAFLSANTKGKKIMGIFAYF